MFLDERLVELTAVKAAREAGSLLKEMFFRPEREGVEKKGENDFVTSTDHEAEKLIAGILSQEFPDMQILGEEHGLSHKSSPHIWVVDPLDGTANFIRGIPHFAVSIALLSEGETIFGVVFNPIHEEWFLAFRGRGSFLNGKPIHVSETRFFEDSYGATGFPFKNRRSIHPYMETFHDLFHRVKDMRRCGSAALDLAYTACGRYDFFWEAFLNPWDFLAGKIIIEEAGGKTGNFKGRSLGLEKGTVAAANPYLFPELLVIIQNRFFPGR